ncbi:hypothetical protein ACH5RR_039916 [Cinchona calisaya]|uniref:Ankyrin repeat-containing protein n=1 Tax=Cinchona calisaya TaxID=153742 RepID=A0ABD2Y589_9GENT
MEKKLYDATLVGDVTAPYQSLQEDPPTLDRAILAFEDKTPLHLTTMMGNVDFIKANLQVNYFSSYYFVEKAEGGGTILHLCVKYKQLEALKILVNTLKSGEFMNAQDENALEKLPDSFAGKYATGEEIYLLLTYILELRGEDDSDAAILFLTTGSDAEAIAATTITIALARVTFNKVSAAVKMKKYVPAVSVTTDFITLELELLAHATSSFASAITLFDVVKIILWGDMAINEGGLLEAQVGERPIVAITDVQKKVFQGTVDMIENKSKLWYDACQNCTRSIIQTDEGVQCRSCSDVQIVQSRLTLNVSQGNARATVTLFEDAATVYIGCSVSDYIQSVTEEWIENRRNAIMVVASLIATMAFQAGISPPGGVWQDDLVDGPNPHRAGEAVMAQTHPKYYRVLIAANTIAFVSSLNTITLLIRGSSISSIYFICILASAMLVATATTTITYATSLVAVAPKDARWQLSDASLIQQIVISVWIGLMVTVVYDIIFAVIYIVEHSKIRVNIKDADGKTGLYLLLGRDNIDPKVKSSLENHRALPGTDVLSIEFLEWIENSRNAIMVVASLIATMAFQEGISPPGVAPKDVRSQLSDASLIQLIVITGERERKKELYDAALIGDVAALNQLLQDDLLACEDKTPLHLAAMMGHVDFINAIVQVNNSSYYYMFLARDRDKRNPLHLAVIYDKLEVLQVLINVRFQAVHHHMCLARDQEGRNPLHLAAIHGRLEILQVLINSGFEAVLEKVEGGGTILHLCVKYNQLEALDILVNTLKNGEFVNAQDEDGMTILHLATYYGQNETIKYLLRHKKRLKLRVNIKNAKGKTAKDILLAQDGINSEILRSLRYSGGLVGAVVSSGDRREIFDRSKNTIMVVASLIATMAFQVVVRPPGGVWQDEITSQGPNNNTIIPHKIGEAVMAQTHPKYYWILVRTNTIAFVSSLTTIITLISMTTAFVSLYILLMWLAIITIAVTYAISLVVAEPKGTSGQLSDASKIVLIVLMVCSCYVVLGGGWLAIWVPRFLKILVANIRQANTRN